METRLADDPHKLQEKSDRELYEWIAGWKPDTHNYIAGQQELKRRNAAPSEFRAWLAIGMSGVALIVSVIALFTKS